MPFLKMYTVGYFLLVLLLFSPQHVYGRNVSKDEFDLKNDIFKRYLRSVRPVHVYNTPVNVSFDVALRSVVDLDEKNQILTTSTWIRVYWKDENLVWDPKDYDNIQSINLRREEIWVPDLVLYNSADGTGRGLLDFAMRTNIILNYDGSCSWLCPMVLKSECTVDIEFFPFDRQSCPLQFGLWTYDVAEVNYTIARKSNTADLSNYLPSGEWVLEGVPAKRVLEAFPCCPVPFPYIIYNINIVRRTKFFLMNLIWPGILIALLAALSFMLPPECGERVGLGITNLLAMMVFLLLVSESIPPTSDAIPLASKFFTSVLVLSALTLLSSALVITVTITNNPNRPRPPWFISVVINTWVAKALRIETGQMCCKKKKKRKPRSYTLESFIIENAKVNQNGDTQHNAQNGIEKYEHKRHSEAVIENGAANNMDKNVETIAESLDDHISEEEYHQEWRKAARVLDRIFLLCFLISIFSSWLYFYIRAPRFYVG